MQAWSGTCRVLVLAWLVAVLAALQAAPALAAGRYALVIGNGNYQNAQQLPNAVKDATDLAAALEKLGFNVDLGTDLTNREFKNRISDFRATVRANKASEAVFYYAGHGFALRGLNHLVPVDAELQDKDRIPYETLQLGDVVDTIQGADGQQTVIFLDACRDNPLPAKLRDKSEGLAKFEPQTDGIYLAFATAPGQVTHDGKGKNSPFASALLKYIDEPGQSVSSLMIKVRNDVKKVTKSSQVPWSSTDTLSADFIFNVPIASVDPPAKQPAPPPLPEPGTKTDEQDCNFNGCDVAGPAIPDTSKPKKTDALTTMPPAGGATVPTESPGDTVEGTVMGNQPQEGLSTDVSNPPPTATETPDNGTVGEGLAAPAAPSAVPAPAANEIQSTELMPDDVTRSAQAIQSKSEVALEVKDGTIITGSVPDSSGVAGADAGTSVQGQVLAGPDAAPVTNAPPAAEGQANQAPATKEPAAAHPVDNTGTVINGQGAGAGASVLPADGEQGKDVNGQVLTPPANSVAAGSATGKVIEGQPTPAATETVPADAGAGKTVEGQILQATAETAAADSAAGKIMQGQVLSGQTETAPADGGAGKVIEDQVLPAPASTATAPEAETAPAAPAPEAGGDAIPSTVTGTMIDGQIVGSDPAPAIVPDAAAGSGQTEQGNTVVASLPAQAMNVQAELARVGCFKGKPDGNWGQESRDALGEYLNKKNLAADLLEPTDSLLSDLKAEPDEAICVADNVQAPAKKETAQPSKPKPQPVRPARPAPVKVKPAPRPQPVKVQPVKPRPPAPPKKKRPDIFIGN